MFCLSSFERTILKEQFFNKNFQKRLALYSRYDIIDIVLEKRFLKSGDDSEEVTPVPIPNTEVKLFSADGSWG